MYTQHKTLNPNSLFLNQKMSQSQTLPLKRQQSENPSDDGSTAIKPSRLKISLPSEDSDKKVTPLYMFLALITENISNPNFALLFHLLLYCFAFLDF